MMPSSVSTLAALPSAPMVSLPIAVRHASVAAASQPVGSAGGCGCTCNRGVRILADEYIFSLSSDAGNH